MTSIHEQRLFAVSDVHIDYAANFTLLEDISNFDFINDGLIVAGDATDNLEKLQAMFDCLQKKFKQVFFVPGNHELWLRKDLFGTSLQKFDAILALCAERGILTSPAKVGDTWVVPLFSWYEGPEHGESSLFLPKPGEDRTHEMWSDFFLAKFPLGLAISQHFLGLNKAALAQDYDGKIISFSHFLPRTELIFPSVEMYRFALERMKKGEMMGTDPTPGFNFSRVAGSWELDSQIRQLGSTMHVYGHQHRNRDVLIEGVRYISHCLGYPKERANRPPGKLLKQLA